MSEHVKNMNEYWRLQRNSNSTSHLHFQKSTHLTLHIHLLSLKYTLASSVLLFKCYIVFLPQNTVKTVTSTSRWCLIFQLLVPQIQFKSLSKNSWLNSQLLKLLPKLLIKQTTSIFIPEDILGIGKKKLQWTSSLNAVTLQHDYNSYY